MTHEQAIDAFQKAVEEHAFIGAVPEYSEDDEEQAMIDRERRRLKSNLKRARTNLLKFMNTIGD